MTNADSFDIDLTEEQVRKRATVDQLVKLVDARWSVAVQERAGVTQAMLEADRAVEGKPITGVHADPELPLVLNITRMIAHGTYVLLSDAMTAAAQELFTLKASPDVTLPPARISEIVAAVQDELSSLASLGVVTDMADMAAGAAAMVEAQKGQMQTEASNVAAKLQNIIKDRLVEARFDTAFRQALRDYVTYPAMVIKAPASLRRKVRAWGDSGLQFRDEWVRGVERIHPMNFFLAPGACGPQPHESEYVIEVRRLTPEELINLIGQEGYDNEELLRAARLYDSGHVEMQDGTFSLLADTGTSNASLQDAYTRSNAYDVRVHYGRVKGSLLQTMGVAVDNPDISYEAEIAVVGECVIRAVLNPDPMGRRPFYMRAFYPSTNSAWGESPVTLLRTIQRAVTSLYVAMIGDAALSGHHIEFDPSMLTTDDKSPRNAVRPRLVRIVKQTGTRTRAVDIHSIAPNTAAYSAEIERHIGLAYELIGIPRMAFGQTAGSGTIGRTAGGVAAMLNQSSKGVREALLSLEGAIIEPVVQFFTDWELMWSKDVKAQGDVNVQARGITGLLEQQAAVDDLQWALQSLSSIADKVNPATQQPIVPPTAVPMLLQRMFKLRGIPTEGMFDQDYELVGTLQGAADPRPSKMGGGIALDGRSPAAAAAIQTANNPAGIPGAPSGENA